MTFVRLAGCSVQDCHIRAVCDETPWKSTFKLRTIDIVDRVRTLQGSGIVCITGGEPTDHDLLPLATALIDAGFRLHLETSGVRSVAGLPLEWLTVSPKTDDYVQRSGHTLKIVVKPEWGTAAQAWDIVAALSADTNFFHRYLQPLTSPDGSTNLATVVEMLTGPCHRNAGARWALSTQAHKAWLLP
jgi:organic radical activating enzyme